MIIITGADGQLGRAFGGLLPSARLLARSELDLSRRDVAWRIADYSPSAIINCAAFTDIDAAEDEEELARRVNATAVAELAEYSSRFDIPFVTFSCDNVFDGSASTPYVESSPPQPLSAYGRAKLEGERAAVDAYAKALVVRTSWLMSGTPPSFLATVLERAATEEAVPVVADQLGRPTFAADLARATLHALGAGATGLLHLTNDGTTTWFDVARRAVELAGLRPEVVRPCSTAQYPTRALRPEYGALESERRAAYGLPSLPHWETSLPAIVKALLASEQ